MSALTPKQEAFCSAIASGMTQAEAYRSAYNADKQKEQTVWSNASRLMADSNVLARVAELKAQLEAKQLWTREQSVTALIEVMGEGSPRDKVAAVKELNAMHGFNAPTQLNVTTRQLPASIDDFV